MALSSTIRNGFRRILIEPRPLMSLLRQQRSPTLQDFHRQDFSQFQQQGPLFIPLQHWNSHANPGANGGLSAKLAQNFPKYNIDKSNTDGEITGYHVTLRMLISKLLGELNEVEEEEFARDMFSMLLRELKQLHIDGLFVPEMGVDNCLFKNDGKIYFRHTSRIGVVVEDLRNVMSTFKQILACIREHWHEDHEFRYLFEDCDPKIGMTVDTIQDHFSLFSVEFRRDILDGIYDRVDSLQYSKPQLRLLDSMLQLPYWKSYCLPSLITHSEETKRRIPYRDLGIGFFCFFRNMVTHEAAYRYLLKEEMKWNFTPYTCKYIEYVVRSKTRGNIFELLSSFYMKTHPQEFLMMKQHRRGSWIRKLTK